MIVTSTKNTSETLRVIWVAWMCTEGGRAELGASSQWPMELCLRPRPLQGGCAALPGSHLVKRAQKPGEEVIFLAGGA